MKYTKPIVVIALIFCCVFVDSHTHSHSHGHSHSHSHSHSEVPKVQTTINDDLVMQFKQSSWVKPILATILISIAPVPVLFLIPIQTGKQSKLLNVLLSFAVGGLLGDVFLHLLPHSTPHEVHDESAPHNHTSEIFVGLWVLAGIITFLIVEKLVRSSHSSASGHSHSHSHSHKDESSVAQSNATESTLRQRKPTSTENKTSPQNTSTSDNTIKEPIAVSGWLNLVADFSHNFTDGLAIGASFLAGEKLGYITTFAILLHEIPHEIGDFAILVQSGFSKKNAILAQFSTAIGAVVGTVIGLLAEGIGETTLWILPFTAGGFIYIATVTVIPILLEDTSFKQSVKEIFALCFGVALMYLVALYE